MAVKTSVLLLSESGDVTVARRTAYYTYGKFDVILPEGQEQQVIDDRIADGYIARAHDGNVGRFDFGFIRADATVNIDAGTSDLETQIDSAELRTEGDVFFESDIGPEGFNGFVPGVDFDIGDIVSVGRWGARLSLPVTDIEYEVTQSSGPRASRVHVSGQLIHDEAARRRANDDLRQQIAAEKRERLRQVGAVDQKATQAKDTADTALQATSDNRTYIDQKVQEAYDSIELGRGYLESMEQHVATGAGHVQAALDYAGQAEAAAQQAEQLLLQLDPLRDDVVAIHAQVERLGQDAASYAVQAAQAVTDAATHVTAAEAAAAAAEAHAEAGRGHATAAGNSAQTAQQLVNDAEGILSSTRAARDAAQSSLDDARGLLNSVPGDGRSLTQILAQVVSLHQQTLTAHGDILDAHAEVLQKHGEAIAYAASAAAQAAMAAQFAMDTARDAAEAARQAGFAAADAAEAARLNGLAIGRLQQADQKLIEADQKLQQQIDILEDSQLALIQATKLLSAAIARNSAAAQSALMAANDAGKAAGSALDAVDALADTVIARQNTVDAFQATQDAIDAEQNELIAQIQAQQEELAQIQNESVNVIMATSAGTSFPGVNTRASSGGYDWEFTIPDTRGALAKIEFWSGTGISKTLTETQVSAVSSSGLVIRTYNDRFVQVTWAKPKAVQRLISELSTTAFTPSQTTWTTVSGISVTAGNRASQGYLTVRVRWNQANRGSTYGIRLLVNGAAVGQKYSTQVGPLSFLGDGTTTQTVNIPNVSVPAGRSVQVQVHSTASSSARRVTRVELSGTWVETQ